ncbi:MAG: Asp-tRNA(Asn)/Glu-tRNA(Gln) amidotransferase subunit GatB, partial [Acidimicrobiia bacterium]
MSATADLMDYDEVLERFDPVLGLEVHVELGTASKMFCGCATTFGAPPNTQTCPVCLGLPGSLPVINGKAVELGLRAAVALGCHVHASSQFHRKNYYYPDLPKNYQITQYEYKIHPPLGTTGSLELMTDGSPRRIRIRRVHLEEDTGKLVHVEQGGQITHSLIDFNRSGIPLMEVVTEPDVRSPQEARTFLGRLRTFLQAIGVSSGRMEEGSLRCEPNLSLRPVGQQAFGTKVELKNINSFKFVKDAIEYEIKRQTKVLNEGGKIYQETRLWDVDKGQTAVMRSKEEAHDYRYFPDPDLVPIKITPERLEQAKRTLPELPVARQERFVSQYG